MSATTLKAIHESVVQSSVEKSREEISFELGLDPNEVYFYALGSFQSALDTHLALAPDRLGAVQAAVADVLLTGIQIGTRIR